VKPTLTEVILTGKMGLLLILMAAQVTIVSREKVIRYVIIFIPTLPIFSTQPTPIPTKHCDQTSGQILIMILTRKIF